MTASMPNPSLSWDRVLPAPHALLNGNVNDLHPRRSSSLLQHHLFSSKDLLESPKDRRSTVPSISYQVDPKITPNPRIPPRGSLDSSASDQSATGPLTRKPAALLMADDSKTRETSPATTQDSNSEATNQFCLCQPDPKIPRPRNAFILYRQHHQAAVVAKHPGLPNPEISKIIGEEWRALPAKTKTLWKALAEEEKLRHQQQYPDYRYQPRRFGRNGNTQPTTTSTTAGPTGNCLRCGGKTMNPPPTPHAPIFPANGALPAGMIRSPPTANSAVIQTPRRPHPLAHINLPRQLPYTMSSPPPSGSAISRVRPFGEVFAGGAHPSMSEAEYRARFGSQPMTPDPKRRRFIGPGVMVPARGALTSPTAAYPHGHPYSPRRVSLPRPTEGAMHPAHPRGVPQGQAPRANYMPQHPRYASLDTRDPSLTLAPLQTPNSAEASTAPSSSKRTSSAATAEAQIMSIPAVNKIRLLAKAAPPLPHPSAAKSKLKSPTSTSTLTSTPSSRGAILAIEGSEEDVQVVTEWLAEFLRNESDEFLVRAFLGPDISSVMAGAKNEEEVDMVGTQQQRYLKAISEWHWVSKEVVRFITTVPAKLEEGNGDEKGKGGEGEGGGGEEEEEEEKMDIDSTSTSSPSPTSAVSPRTITQTERLSLKSPTATTTTTTTTTTTIAANPGSHTKDTCPPTPPPHSSSSSSSFPTPPFPIALLPRYQLSTVDTAALTMPITDSYLPIDHWQWAAALWRGCVGADVTIVIQDGVGGGLGGSSSSAGSGEGSVGGSAGTGSSGGGSGGGVEVRLGPGDVRAVIVRKGGSGSGSGSGSVGEKTVIEAGALRRLGFEIVEFLRR